MLGPILLSIHNLTYYQRLLAEARQALEQGRFLEWRQQKKDGWNRARDAGSTSDISDSR
jgi:queuine tRNA-ribosyltransferase